MTDALGDTLTVGTFGWWGSPGVEAEAGLPVVEQIALAIVARLESVTVVNGYNTTVAGVERPTKTGGGIPDHLKVFVIQEDPALAPNLDVQGNPPAAAQEQPFLIQLLVRPSDTDTTPVDTAINTFRADVERALMTDCTWGSLAQDSRITDRHGIISSDGAFEGVELRLNVAYRTDENNPYNVR